VTPIRLMLFDIAGTLVADEDRVLRLYAQMIRDHDLPPRDPAWLLATMGRSKRDVFAAMLGAAPGDPGAAPRAKSLIRDFERRLNADLDARPPRLLPGAAETIAQLRAAGITPGYTTGFSRTIAERLLAETALHLSPGAASDEVARGRPAPNLIVLAMQRAGASDPATVGVCGDTPGDLQAGANAGCGLIIGVCNGTHLREQLAAHPHTHLLETLESFGDVVGIG